MARDAALAGTSASELAPAEHFGLNLNLRGGEKQGKTYIALATAPEPVVYLNGDRDNSRLLRLLVQRGRKIIHMKPYMYTLPGPKQVTKKMDAAELRAINQANSDTVRPIFERWRKEFKAALESKARSIVVDTGTWVYQSLRLADYGTLSPPKWLAQEYKGKMEAIMHMADDYGKLVIWIHRWAEEWGPVYLPDGSRKMNDMGEPESAPTGKMKTEGYDKTDYVVDATVELGMDLEGTGARQAKIISGIRGAGKVFEGEEGQQALSIPALCAYITKSQVGNWS